MQGPGGSGCGLVRGLVYASRLPRALAALAHFVSSSTLLQFCFNFTASCSQVLFASDRVTKKTTPKFELLYFPTISELKKFPILTKAPPKVVGTIKRSNIQASGLYG
mgnify:CR=1 FL=1